MFEAVFTPATRAACNALSSEGQAQADEVIQSLELDPWADDETKVTLTLAGIGLGVYDDDRWEVVYRVLDDRFIEVVGISRIEG